MTTLNKYGMIKCAKCFALRSEAELMEFEDQGVYICTRCIEKRLEMTRIDELLEKREKHPDEWRVPKDREELMILFEDHYNKTKKIIKGEQQ